MCLFSPIVSCSSSLGLIQHTQPLLVIWTRRGKGAMYGRWISCCVLLETTRNKIVHCNIKPSSMWIHVLCCHVSKLGYVILSSSKFLFSFLVCPCPIHKFSLRFCTWRRMSSLLLQLISHLTIQTSLACHVSQWHVGFLELAQDSPKLCGLTF